MSNFNNLNKYQKITKDYYFQLISEEKVDECITIFSNPINKCWEFIDDNGFTALHRSCIINNLRLTEIIIKKTRENISSTDFMNYINKQNNKGFTPLHYAAYKGNMKIILLLLKNNADIKIRNKSGLNMIHIASQANKSTPIYYLNQTYGFDLMDRDKNGNTPLHWACYFKSEKVINFLLCYNYINVNCQNQEGLTPLHLSVSTKNIRVIKKLLIRGSDINIKDHKGENSLDLSLRLKDKEIFDILNSTKNKNKKIVFNPYTIIIFYAYQIIIPFIIIFINIPFINNNLNTLIRFVMWYIFFYGILYYFIKKDPGNVKNYTNNFFPLLNLIEDYDININDYCPICEIKHSGRSKHCFICNTCIDNFDHHCIWMGKCVGKNNNHLFYFIQFLMIFEFIYNSIICLESLFNNKIYSSNFKGIYYIIKDKKNYEEYKENVFLYCNNKLLWPKYITTLFIFIIGIFGSYIIYPLIKFYINELKRQKEEKLNKKNDSNLDDNSINNFKIYKKENIIKLENENEKSSLLV